MLILEVCTDTLMQSNSKLTIKIECDHIDQGCANILPGMTGCTKYHFNVKQNKTIQNKKYDLSYDYSTDLFLEAIFIILIFNILGQTHIIIFI